MISPPHLFVKSCMILSTLDNRNLPSYEHKNYSDILVIRTYILLETAFRILSIPLLAEHTALTFCEGIKAKQGSH